jgi:3-carboxy-cis,cis-muconate cycloisomerase
MSEELFRPNFALDKNREAVSGRAWLGAMLDVEGALAQAEAQAGLIPPDAGETFASRCDAGLVDPEELGRRGRALRATPSHHSSGCSRRSPRYRKRPPGTSHKGATSQDIVDTAAMLVARRALDLILIELDEISRSCARLAEAFTETQWVSLRSEVPDYPF